VNRIEATSSGFAEPTRPSDDRIILDGAHISKRYGGTYALRDAQLTARAGRVHGLVGENGAGKSTLAKIISGVVDRDGGDLYLDGESLPLSFEVRGAQARGIRVVHQDQPVIANMSAATSVFLGNELKERPSSKANVQSFRSEAERILLTELGWQMDMSRLGRDLLPDERVAVAVAGALVGERKVLILDEPTAYLDRSEVSRVFRIVESLKARGIAVIYISHFLDEIFSICDDLTIVRDGQTVWSGEVSSTTSAEVVRRMVGKDLDTTVMREAGLDRSAAGGISVCEIHDLSVADRLASFSLKVEAGETVAVVGLGGSGTAVLADVLSGSAKNWAGKVTIAGKRARLQTPHGAGRDGVMYVPRDRHSKGIFPDLSLRENLVVKRLRDLGRFGVVNSSVENSAARSIVSVFGVVAPSLGAPITTLSGGNQQKAIVGRVLSGSGKLVVLDEPTVGVDVGSREEIYGTVAQLRRDGAGILLITGDVEEALRVSDRVVVLFRGREVLSSSVSELGHEAREIVVSAVVGAGTAVASAAPLAENRESAAAEAGLPVLGAGYRPRRHPFNASQVGVMGMMLAIYVAVALRNSDFLAPSNLLAIFGTGASAGLLAAGISLALMVNGLDINIGGVAQLAGGVLAVGAFSAAGASLGLATLAAVGIGLSLGLISGLLVGYLKIPGFVVTLGALFVSLGLHLLVMGGIDRTLSPTAISSVLGAGGIAGVSGAALLALGLVALVWLLLRNTTPGLWLRAAEQGTPLMLLRGIRLPRVILLAYVGSALLGTAGGLVRTLYGGGASATDQSSILLLLAVAGAFLGRAFTRNGGFNPLTAFVGGLLLAGIENSLIVVGFSNQASGLVEGLVLLVAIAGSTLAVRKRPRFSVGQEKVI
jgi:ABC-type sugar transport system ATPase subunit/ribose/xylose/arabinose/galactoside ABC-type transport system permease subunit